jgi:para-nitrobenzyl esterase
LWDQQFALQWVKRNIASFGGDPAQVTIFGESAGSLDVCFHVASPASRDLFGAAISESGGCTTFQTTQQDGEAKTLALAKKLGCTGDGVLDCLRSKSVADLLQAAPTGSGAGFGPVVDGEFLPEQPRALFDRGDIARVPYILGSNTDEGTLFTFGNTSVDSEETLRAALKQNLTVSPDDVLKHYSLSDFSDQPKPYLAAFARILGDATLVCSTYDVAVRNADAGAETYMYNFDIPANVPGLGATHGSELVYVFGTSSSLDDDQKRASDHIQSYWTNFAKTGDPNGGDLAKWPRFSAKSNQRVNLALETTQIADFRAAECEYWRSVYDMRFTQNN